ncbi:MAG: hypothetical protein AB7S26_03000 [Sandaracinaceae bacterium]
MTSRGLPVFAFLTLVWLGGCGASSPSEPTAGSTSPDESPSQSTSTETESTATESTPTTKQRVERAMDALIAACRADDVAAAAAYIVYRGNDAARRWRGPVDPSAPDEREAATHICERLNGLNGAGYERGEYMTRQESEGVWHAFEVTFQTPDRGAENAILAFLEVDGAFLLGDID